MSTCFDEYLPFSLSALINHIRQVEQKPGGRGRGRKRATLDVHPLSCLLSNNRLEKVPFVSVPHTSSNRLLLSNQDKGCTPCVAHSLALALPLGPALLNLWTINAAEGDFHGGIFKLCLCRAWWIKPARLARTPIELERFSAFAVCTWSV